MTTTKDIAKSIKTMLSDIKSEIIIADLIERGYPLGKILVRNEGLFKRNFTKDVTDVYLDVMNDVLVFHVSRDSLYDILPQNMFHESKQLGNVESEERKKRFEAIKKEEENARKFFLPFDNELFYQKVECESAYRSFLVDPGNFFQKLFLFDDIGRPKYTRKLVTYALYNNRFVGNIELTAACLSDLIGEEVRAVSFQNNEKLSSNNISPDDDYVLGESSICGEQVSELGLQWEFTIILNDDNNILDFVDIKHGKMNQLLKIFYEYFIPYEFSIKTNVVSSRTISLELSSKQSSKEGKSTAVEKNIYLGYNANI